VGALFAALGLVFVAELGDKTQLVALSFGARNRLAPVLVGLVCGYAAVNLLSVVVGALLGVALPTRAIGIGGGILFLAFAAWTAWGLRPARPAADVSAEELTADRAIAEATVSHRSVVLAVAGAIFVAELGDKTMLATATLAAKENPVLVWIGATTGIVLAGTVGVLLGRAFGARLAPRVTQLGSAILFTVFGLVLLVANV
jgi:putative Ca2+/H+ antiporter (TMEM165/GDT1 family)